MVSTEDRGDSLCVSGAFSQSDRLLTNDWLNAAELLSLKLDKMFEIDGQF
jgi:hypothetical protein